LLDGHEEQGHAGLGEQGRRHRRDAAVAEALGDRVAQGGALAEVAFAQAGVGADNLAALAEVGPPALEAGLRHRPQRADDQREGVGRGRCLGDHAAGHGRQFLLAGEEHLALVGVVPEEGAGGEPGPLRDLRDGRRREALLGEELESGVFEPFPRVRTPSAHRADSS
jgi:hypothetical protein